MRGRISDNMHNKSMLKTRKQNCGRKLRQKSVKIICSGGQQQDHPPQGPTTPQICQERINKIHSQLWEQATSDNTGQYTTLARPQHPPQIRQYPNTCITLHQSNRKIKTPQR